MTATSSVVDVIGAQREAERKARDMGEELSKALKAVEEAMAKKDEAEEEIKEGKRQRTR